MATVFEWASSTYSCTASSTCGGRSRVSPVYQTASPVATTAVASLPSSRTVFDRLSKRSWPLMASILHFLPVADRHAHPVALDQPAALVDDRVGRVLGFKRGVDGAGEILQLGPQRLAIGEVAELVALQEVAGQFAHLHRNRR